MWKFKPAKITGRRRKVNYNLSIYKNYRNCLECLWIKVDWGGMSGVCVLSLEKGPMEAFLEDSRGPSFRWRRWSFCTELLVVNGSLWCSCKCMNFLCGFVVTVVIMSAGLLGMHAGNLFIIYNRLPWMQGQYTSSICGRENGVKL